MEIEMAHREALHTIRAARAGHAVAQLELGKKYLFGGAGLPKNSASALYWLDRAAQQQQEDAWVLIGSYIPFETAQHATNIQKLCFWYRRAFEAGELQAGIVFAKLVLAYSELLNDAEQRAFALHAIRVAAEAGHGEALWLWAQVCRGELFDRVHAGQPGQSRGEGKVRQQEADTSAWQVWAMQAAAKGIDAARQALETDAWDRQDYHLYLKWAWPPARALVQATPHSSRVLSTLNARDVELLKRCAHALEISRQAPPEEIQAYWETAAQAGDAQAQFTLGLLLAKMDESGQRTDTGSGRVVYKKALRWLKAAAEQGRAEAYYLISRIYLKPEFSQRDSVLAQQYLQQAAQAGHVPAQLEWAADLWRRRANENGEDVEALYWFSQAANQGSDEAQRWLGQVAASDGPQTWARQASDKLGNERVRQAHAELPLASQYLAARIELALLFGLSRAEALLLDIGKADCGHCLVIDIRQHHPRSKRRLVAMQSEKTRQAVNRIRQLFQQVDCSEHGPEGNYRRRLYRLKNLMGPAQNPVRAVPGVISRSRLQIPSLPVRSS